MGERRGEEPIYDFVYCHPNLAPQPALWLMQLFEMSWQPAKPGVNQQCQSATTASERGRGEARRACMLEQRCGGVRSLVHMCM